jgi:hypothetical protein
MYKTIVIVAALGLFGMIGLTPVIAGTANSEGSTEFRVAQAQETGGTASSKSKSKSKKVAKKKSKPTKKQRYERSN